MAQALAHVEMRTPAVPLIANVLAAPISNPAEIRRCLVEQVTLIGLERRHLGGQRTALVPPGLAP